MERSALGGAGGRDGGDLVLQRGGEMRRGSGRAQGGWDPSIEQERQ